MLMTKRGGDDLTRPGENKRACCSGEEENESPILGDLRLDSSGCIWSETMQEVASNLSRTVVSVVLSNGHTVLFACSGIAIESGESLSLGARTCFLTSACLVRALDDNKTKYHDDLKIEVRYEGNVYEGCLQQYDFDHDIALVHVMMCLHVNAMYFGDVESPPYSKVVAVGRDISGKLMATSGILTSDSSILFCSSAWRGGPLVDFDGNFVGMNLCLVTEGTLFLPEELILERLAYFRTSLRRTKFIARLSNAVRNGGRPIGDISKSDPEVHRVIPEDEIIVDINSLGYPKPSKSMLHDGMVLVNTFEEPFGDVYCEGVWSELSKKVSNTICRNVVALASFNGETRVFACTGFFIEWDGLATILTSASLVRNSVDHNNIDENLRIEVRLPNNKYRAGRLEHYNLHYNVALVSVKDFRAVRPVIFQHECCYGRPSMLVAVGRCFESGTLMASKGRLSDWSGKLDCKFLVHSTCKTTKAGIGGPLVDFSGRFIGMNFYEKNIGTPSLLCNHIIIVLQSFKKKGSGKKISSSVPFWTMDMDKDETVPPNRWPVPKPYWCHRDDLAEDISVFAPNGRMIYGYREGKIAGIGHPLVDFSGKFIGMNFYEKNIGTPSLLCNEIIVVLESFKKKDPVKKISSSMPFWTMDMDKDETVPPNRWPVPEPYWCHRDNCPEDISVFAPNGLMLYVYREGKMVQTYSTSKIHQVLVLYGRALHHLSHNKEWLLYSLVIFRVRLD